MKRLKKDRLIFPAVLAVLIFAGCASIGTTARYGDEELSVYDKLLAPALYGKEMPGSAFNLDAEYYSVYLFPDGSLTVKSESTDAKTGEKIRNYYFFRDSSHLRVFSSQYGNVDSQPYNRDTGIRWYLGRINFDREAEELTGYLEERGLMMLYRYPFSDGSSSDYRIYMDVNGSRLRYAGSVDMARYRKSGDQKDWYNRLQDASYSLKLEYRGNMDMEPLESFQWERGLSGWRDQAALAMSRYEDEYRRVETSRLNALNQTRRTYSEVMARYSGKTDWGPLIAEALATVAEDFSRDMERIYSLSEQSAYGGMEHRMTSTYRDSSGGTSEVASAGSSDTSGNGGTAGAGGTAGSSGTAGSDGLSSSGVHLTAESGVVTSGGIWGVPEICVNWGPDCPIKNRPAAMDEADRLFQEAYRALHPPKDYTPTPAAAPAPVVEYPRGWVRAN